ncbi:MAG: acyl-CoA dehydratase activase [Fidelibacterota bacterium]
MSAAVYYLGIDLGSSYTKFVVINQDGNPVFRKVIPTLSRHREAFNDVIDYLQSRYMIKKTCTTGYGRNSYQGNIKKTELVCASAGVSVLHPIHKSILDIGGEDIKIIESGPRGEVRNFYMNDKCSAGTGAFITEIAEKAELDITEMNDFAQRTTTDKTINSFCTVFAKTEIMGWKFKGVPLEEIARGIYLSIVNRICKLPVNSSLPLFLCGGVIAYHPFLGELLGAELGIKITVSADPQFVIAQGAAALARNNGSLEPEINILSKHEH